MLLRIDRILSNYGYCTRREAKGFLERHEVRSNGELMVRVNARVDPRTVTIDGVTLAAPAGQILMLNKPVGFTCSRVDPGPIVYDLLPEGLSRREPPFSSVGRLDKDTSGLLLFTDNGQLLHQLTSPKRHVPRTYLVTLADPLRGDEEKVFASGELLLRGESQPLLPAELTVLTSHQARLVLHEGRYHQVRRMFAALGNKVENLHREAFGALTLEGVPEGEYRWLTDQEVDALCGQPHVAR